MRPLLATLALCAIVTTFPACRLFDHNVNNNDSTKTDSIVNRAIALNGYSSYLEVASKPDLQLCEGNFTIETWVYYNRFGGDWQVILAKDNMDSNTEFLLTADAPTGKFRFQTRDFSTVLYSSSYVEARKWYHIAITQDFAAGVVTLYINGVAEATKTLEGRIVTTNYPVRIGTRINDITSGSPWYVVDGQIDDIRIWNTVRSQTEINATRNTTLKGNENGLVAYWNFNEGSGANHAVDATGRGHSAVFHNGPLFAKTTCPVH